MAEIEPEACHRNSSDHGSMMPVVERTMLRAITGLATIMAGDTGNTWIDGITNNFVVKLNGALILGPNGSIRWPTSNTLPCTDTWWLRIPF